jgi:hypothetical protein
MKVSSMKGFGTKRFKDMTEEEQNVHLRLLFTIDLEAGKLWWKERPAEWFTRERYWRTWNTEFAGKLAGSLNKHTGYVTVRLDRTTHKMHRILRKLKTGVWPIGLVDHEDRCRSNNREDNLRDATVLTNCHNRVRNLSKKGGLPPGVRMRDSGRFSSCIVREGHSWYIGTFDTEGQASEAYKIAARLYDSRGFFPKRIRLIGEKWVVEW